MDIASIIGLIVTLFLLLGAMAMGVGIGAYIDIPSFFIVFGGTFGALLIAFKIEQIKNIFTYFLIAIKPPKEDLQQLVKKMVEYATKARRDGILSLEFDVNNENNKFLKQGLYMAIDGSEPDTVRDLLRIEMEETSIRHRNNANIFSQMANFSGAMGIIGTLIGLVAMLLNMSDPSSIGPSMAVALLTTMYGALIGNIIGIPVANILNIRDKDEVLAKTLIMEGIMCIQLGDSPRILELKLLSFLPPKERESQF